MISLSSIYFLNKTIPVYFIDIQNVNVCTCLNFQSWPVTGGDAGPADSNSRDLLLTGYVVIRDHNVVLISVDKE